MQKQIIHQPVAQRQPRGALRLLLATLLLTSTLPSHATVSTLKTATAVPAAVLIAVDQVGLHAPWQTLLSQYVKPIHNGHSSAVDYAGLQTQRTQLQDYLNTLAAITRAEFDSWANARQLAFLINAYNAWTVELILTKYPDLNSIKDLGWVFSSPWSKKFIPLLGKKVSLDNIEHDLIRGSGRYNDPRIHFAVNCASIGCPALREEAYRADQLEQQLNAQTIRFVSDTTRNYITADTLYLSSIFKWYDDDFKAGFRGTTSVEGFLLRYAQALKLTESQKSALKKRDLDIKYLDYDWKLNRSD